MGKKRRTALYLGLAVSMGMTVAGSTMALVGCQTEVADVTGVYYAKVDDQECIVKLDGASFTFEMSIGGKISSGDYTYDGSKLNLTFGDQLLIAELNHESGVLSMTYNGVDYELTKNDTSAVKITYMDGTNAINTVMTLSGGKASEIAAPEKAGYVFCGWYASNNFDTKFDFATTIAADTVIYANYVKIDENAKVYRVKFDLNYDGAPEAEEVDTLNGKIYDLPIPERDGATFLGWWVSDYQSADKLTYQYTDQTLNADTTLFAVWDTGAPAVSVSSTGVTIANGAIGNNYTIVIADADGNELARNTSGASTMRFDFNAQSAGDYTVSVTLNNKTTVVYYKNKALARPSGFSVDGNVLSFDAVEGASEYLISIVCGNEAHNHTDLSLGKNTSYDFSACEMQPEGISFIVKAVADGHATSVSDSFVLIRNLDAVTGLGVDATTGAVVWENVDHAETYKVIVKCGNDELYSGIAESGKLSLKNYDAGNLVISVVPMAGGYNSPDASTFNYEKAALATPSNIKVVGYAISWNEVAGASGYIVKVNGKEYNTTTASYDVSSLVAGQSKITFSVCAKGTTDSLYSDELTFDAAINTATYRTGEVSWNAVLGAVKYGIQVGDAEEVLVDDGSLSAQTALIASGKNVIKVSAYDDAGQKIGSSYEITVNAYAVNFETGGGVAIAPKYLAVGDELILPEAIYAGHSLDGWYDAEEGSATAKKIQNGIFTGNSDVTYYAHWTGKEFTITLSAGEDAVLSTDKATVQFGKDYKLPTPTHPDSRLEFGGWFTEANGRGNQCVDRNGDSLYAWDLYSDTTLYAYWLEMYSFNELQDGTYSVSKGSQTTFSSVTEITIPTQHNGKPVSTVEGAAFQSCTNLQIINIPNSIKLIAMGSQGGNAAGSAFQGCSKLVEVNVYPVDGYTGEIVYWSKDGALYMNRETTNTVELVYYPYGRTGEFEIADGVTTLPINVLKSCPITKLTIPASVNYIGDYAFFMSTNNKLEEVVFLEPKEGETVQPLTVGEEIFKSCSKLVKVTLPSHLAKLSHEVEGTVVEDDFYNMFSGCSKLTEVHISGKGGVYASTDDGLLISADGKTLVYCPLAKAGNYEIVAGVTEIGARAFYKCTKLTSITIPSYIEEIGKEAFYNCYGLTAIRFEGESRDADLVIREAAFYKCTSTSLKELILPANLTVIEQNAFGYCTYLKTVTINCDRKDMNYAASAFNRMDTGVASVTTLIIGANVKAFDVNAVFGGTGSSLATVTVSPNNEFFSSVSGVLYNKDITEILFYPSAKTDSSFHLPDTVVRIGGSVFAGKKSLTTMTIGKNVKEIADKAFSGCTSLENIIFEGGRTEDLVIGNNAFEKCTALTSVAFPEKMVSLGTGAFAGCTALTEVQLPATMTTFGGAKNDVAGVFEGCTVFANIVIAQGSNSFASSDGVLFGVEEGKVDSVLYSPVDNSGDANGVVHIPATVTSVAANAFSGNAKIKEINFAQNTSGETITIGNKAFYKCTGLETVNLPVGLETIGAQLFYGCSSLQDVSIPYTVKSIGAAAFAQCRNLVTVAFDATPEGIKDIVPLTIADGTWQATSATATISATNEPKQGAFAWCTSLQTIAFPERLTKIGNYTFSYAGLVSATFPSTLTAVGNYSFSHNTALNTAIFAASKSNVTFGTYAFEYCALHAADADGEGTGLVLPTKLTTIDIYAFRYNKELTAVELPDSVTRLGTNVFQYCETLETVKLPESLTSIGNYAFGNSGLKSITIPNSVTTLGTNVFSNCKSLESATLPQNSTLKKLSNNLFQNCELLDNVVIPDTYNEIGNYAFSGCKSLKTIDLGSVVTFGTYVFQNCTSLEAIVIPATVKTIGNYAFNGCESLSKIVFDGNVSALATIGNSAFVNTALTEFTFPNSSSANGISIGTTIFNGCDQLTTVHLSASVTSVTQMFIGCPSVTKVTIASGSKNLSETGPNGMGAPLVFNLHKTAILASYSAVSAAPGVYTIPEGITEIGAYALVNQNNITGLVLPSTLTTIGDYAFQNCRMLNNIQINLGAEGTLFEGTTALNKIGQYAFDSCLSLASIKVGDTENVLPASLKEIGNYAFYHCANLKEITVPETVTKVGTFVFQQCVGLETVYHLTKAFGNSMYSYCSNLKTIYMNNDLDSFKATNVFQYCGAIETMRPYDVKTKTALGKEGEVTFPAALTSLPNNAFRYSGIKKLYIPATLTSFGTYVFADTQIESVEFDENASNVNLGEYLFANVPTLKTIINPDAVGTVGRYAFLGCTGLVDVSLPNCEKIGDYSFSGCTSLKSISIPNCKDIGSAFRYYTMTYNSVYTYFYSCSELEKVVLSSDPNVDVKIGNYAFGADATSNGGAPDDDPDMFFRRFACIKLHDINLDRVVSIGSYGFTCCLALKEVSLPVCETLGDHAFYACRNLEKVTLTTDPTKSVTLEKYAFGAVSDERACYNLKEINLERVKTIGDYAFQNCLSLGQNGPLDLSNCTSIGNRAFRYCEGLTEIKLGAVEVGDYVFDSCTNLTKADLSQVTSIGYATFQFCESLSGTLDLSACGSIDGFAFNGCRKLEGVKLSPQITTIGKAMFQHCVSLSDIDFTNIKTLGGWAFYDCPSLKGTIDLSQVTTFEERLTFYACKGITEVILSNNLKTINTSAFSNCSNLVSCGIPGSVTTIESSAFYATGLSGELYLTGVSYVGSDAFAATDIEKVIISDYVSSIGIDAFGQCKNLTAFEVSEDNAWYRVDDEGILYAKADTEDGKQTLICYPAGKSGDVIIDENTNIAPYAFAGCYNVTSITLPANITEIGEYAFWQFQGQIEFSIPDTVTEIQNGAFQGTLLEEVTIPNGVTTISNNTFRNCSNLKKIVIPESVTSIGDYAFASCTALESIEIPASVKTIGAHAFDGCSNLSSITLNEGLQTIGEDAFLGCKKLTSVEIPDHVETIGNYAFENCSGLVTVIFGKNIGTLGTSAFYGCTELTSVTFGDNFGTIGVGAFSRKYTSTKFNQALVVSDEETVCSKLTTLIFEGTVNTIDARAFAFSGVKEVELPRGIENFGEYIFSDCNNLENVVIHENVATYDLNTSGEKSTERTNGMFQYCGNLKSVVFDEGVTQIGRSMFYKAGNVDTVISLPSTLERIPDYCFQYSGIRSIRIPESVTRIGTWAFYNCTSLEEVNIPAAVTYLGDYVFTNTAIRSVDVPALTSVGNYVFQNCKNLANVTLAEGLEKIGCRMFYGCEKLTSITIPSTIKTWGSISGDQHSPGTPNGAFMGTGLTEVTFAEGLTSINGGYAFSGTKITELKIPSSVTVLGSHAFDGCEYITSVTIPENVKLSASYSYIFANCTRLSHVEFEGNFTALGSNMFTNCTSLKTITIPVTVTYVPNVFAGWTSDQTIIIKVKRGMDTSLVNSSSGWIIGWLMNTGAKVVVEYEDEVSATGEDNV